MVFFYNITGSYGLSLILFTFLVNLVLAPFMAKSKKSMMRSTRMQPKIQELQRRHEGNPQKLNAEMQKLYREEGVNPMRLIVETSKHNRRDPSEKQMREAAEAIREGNA